jgi:hypothetical protein
VGVAPRPGWSRAWVMPERSGIDPDDEAVGAEPATVTAAHAPRARPTGEWVEAGRWGDRPPATELPPLPVPLAPMTVTDLLDGAWAILSCRPRTVLALSALIIVPAELVASLLISRTGQGVEVGSVPLRVVPFLSVGPGVSLADVDVSTLVAVAVLSLAYTVLGAALARLVVGWYDDTDLTLRQVVAPLVRRAPALLGAWVLMALAQGAAIAACGLPALFVIPLLLLVAPALAIEGKGPLAAIRRSGQLVRRRLAAVIWIWLVSLVLERFIDALIALAPELLALVVPGQLQPVVRAAGWAFAMFVTAPVVAGLSVLLYIDLRIRTEGLDLLVDAGEAFPEPVGPVVTVAAEAAGGR